MFFKSQDYPIGLDVSDFSLKFVQLNKKRNKIGLQSFGKIQLESGIIENGQIKDMDLFVSKIKELIDNPTYGKVSSKRVVVCLPEPKTFIKLLRISKDEKLLDESIKEELKKYIPIPIEETYFDFQVISVSEENKTILVGVSPKIFVDQYIEAMEKAKLFLVATEIESMSISRALLKEEFLLSGNLNKSYGIIDIGASRSSMFVYSGGTILFNISIPLSGERITEKISKELSINRKQAEAAKIICGIDKSKCAGVVESKISGLIKKLLLRITNVIDFNLEHFHRFGPIEEIIICGGGANIKNLEKEIEQYTGIKSYVGNPFANIDDVPEIVFKKMTEIYKLSKDSASNSKGFSITQDARLTYCTAIGLALREIFIEK